MRNVFTHRINKVTLTLAFLLIFQTFNGISWAQSGGVAPGETVTTNPKSRETVVTATVPDIVPPTAPFLISPEDESLLNDPTPSFIWQRSTDNVGISHYELYLDGSLLYGSIPTSNTSNSQYTLTYNSSSGRYTLTPSSPISDGDHTWRIMVYDAAGNSNTSATWDFTIDTLSPEFVIESIGPIATDISAQDVNSVPDEPIELEDNQPEFTGSGDPNATVQITVQIPGESNEVINIVVGSNGSWSFQLGILPRDEVITLDFIITDEAGNVSVITGLEILIIQEFIIFPPTPTPTPVVSPTPTSTPTESPEPGVSPTPTISPPVSPVPEVSPTPPSSPIPTPIIKIPILPPEEVAEIVKDEIIEAIPEPFLELISVIPEAIRESIQKTVEAVAPVGALIVTAAIPALSLLSLILQFAQQFSWNILLKILQALGLLPPKEPQGMVFDSQTNEPVAFALLTITSTSDVVSERIVETVVTDVDGIYQGVRLPIGKYIITVDHQDFLFPTQKPKPTYLSSQEYYTGEEFEVTSTKRPQLFLIPVDKLSEAEIQQPVWHGIRKFIQKLQTTNLFWPFFIITVLITLFFPTWPNAIILTIYLLKLGKRVLLALRRPTISGRITNTAGTPVQNATVRISDPLKGELVTILSSDKNGEYKAFLEPNKYQIQITKAGYVWLRQGSQLSFEEVDVTIEPQTVNAALTDLNTIYAELFSEL